MEKKEILEKLIEKMESLEDLKKIIKILSHQLKNSELINSEDLKKLQKVNLKNTITLFLTNLLFNEKLKKRKFLKNGEIINFLENLNKKKKQV